MAKEALQPNSFTKEALSGNSFAKEGLNKIGTLASSGFGTATFGVSAFGEEPQYVVSKEPLPSKIS